MPQPAKKLDTRKAIRMKLAGASYRTIAKTCGVDHSAVQRAIAPILQQLPGAEDLAEYKQHQADIYHLVAYRSLRSITDEDIAKASLRDKVIAAGVCTDKARLIAGQSTSNTSIILRSITDLEAEIPD